MRVWFDLLVLVKYMSSSFIVSFDTFFGFLAQLLLRNSQDGYFDVLSGRRMSDVAEPKAT